MENNIGLNGFSDWFRRTFSNRWVRIGVSVLAGVVGSPAFGAAVASFLQMVQPDSAQLRTANLEETAETRAVEKWLDKVFMPAYKAIAQKLDRALLIETRNQYIESVTAIKTEIALILEHYSLDLGDMNADASQLRLEAITALFEVLNKAIINRDKVFGLTTYETVVVVKQRTVSGLFANSPIDRVKVNLYDVDESVNSIASPTATTAVEYEETETDKKKSNTIWWVLAGLGVLYLANKSKKIKKIQI